MHIKIIEPLITKARVSIFIITLFISIGAGAQKTDSIKLATSYKKPVQLNDGIKRATLKKAGTDEKIIEAMRGIEMKPPSIVLDHIYFMVPNHGKEAIKLLIETGFVVNPKVFQIKGEGMASRLILLDNVPLEILWVDDSVSYNSIELLNRLKRKTWYTGNQISPFGVAFRRAPGVGDSLPIPNRASPPEPAGSWAKREVFSTTLRMHRILYLLFFL